jgi:PAS domain S-box-containing protein
MAEERTRDDATLRQSEQRFRLLVDSVVDYAIYILDPEGIVESWNAGAERLKGYREDEIVGRHYSTFYTEDQRAARLPDRLLAQAREQGRVEHRGWRVRKDGSRFWADVVLTALRDEAGRLTGFAKVTRDRTDAHLAEEARERALEERGQVVERLQELDRWRTDFISSIVHDLQTPVISIHGFAELILAEDGEVAEHREFAEQIRSNARSLQDLIDNLRAHTRLAGRRVDLHREPIDVREFVERLVGDLTPVFDQRPVTADIDELEVTADPQGLERILRNLLGNAARHTAPHTPIHVRARPDAKGTLFEIVDEGDGIPAELVSRIFERFERGDRGGTGLGLSIAKQYVELHGGEISLHSTPGGGTTVRFVLPAADEDRLPAAGR